MGGVLTGVLKSALVTRFSVFLTHSPTLLFLSFPRCAQTLRFEGAEEGKESRVQIPHPGWDLQCRLWKQPLLVHNQGLLLCLHPPSGALQRLSRVEKPLRSGSRGEGRGGQAPFLQLQVGTSHPWGPRPSSQHTPHTTLLHLGWRAAPSGRVQQRLGSRAKEGAEGLGLCRACKPELRQLLIFLPLKKPPNNFSRVPTATRRSKK